MCAGLAEVGVVEEGMKSGLNRNVVSWKKNISACEYLL